MEQTYQYLLSLEFRHKYFKDGLFKPLQLSFDAESQQLLKDFGLILKSYPGGLHLLCLDLELLKTASKNTALQILLDCNDPYFINYSDLPNYNPSDTVLYFNNLNSKANSENSALNLHSEINVGKKDVYKLSSGTLKLDTLKKERTYHFKDEGGNDISDNIHIKWIEDNGFLISNRYEGSINVYEKENEIDKVYANPNPVWKKPMAIIELFLSKMFENFEPDKKLKYIVSFNSIKTHWRYILADPIYKNFQNLTIVIKGQENEVFARVTDNPSEGSQYPVFQSIEKLDLLEYSEDFYSLMNDENSSPIIKALPRAAPEHLVFGKDKKTMYSHIYL